MKQHPESKEIAVKIPSVLCIIPARGGSKGIPGKNLRNIAGKPLVAHSILQALQTPAVTSTVVSTDDTTIADIARKFGAEVVNRPVEISGDTASSESALIHALDYYRQTTNIDPDIIVFLQCTSPVRAPNDLSQAIKIFQETEADSLLSATSSHRFLWRNTANGISSLNYDYKNRPRRQDRAPEFVENGSIYIFKPWVLRTLNNRLGGKIALFEMGYWSSFEIDDLEDLALCEWIINRNSQSHSPKASFPAIVQLVVLDFDGVLTDNQVITFQDGTEAVSCNRSDGFGLGLLKASGIPVRVLSKESNPVVAARCRKLGLSFDQGVNDKAAFLIKLFNDEGISKEHVVYMGNDLNDLECMNLVGFSVAPLDAHPKVLEQATLIIPKPGGHGAVRDLCEQLLMSQRSKG